MKPDSAGQGGSEGPDISWSERETLSEEREARRLTPPDAAYLLIIGVFTNNFQSWVQETEAMLISLREYRTQVRSRLILICSAIKKKKQHLSREIF